MLTTTHVVSYNLAQMTTKQTLSALRKAGKPICQSHLYRIFTKLGIKPIGRSRPQQYPEDTSDRVLAHLGFMPAIIKVLTPVPLWNGAGAGKLLTMPEIMRASPNHNKKTKAKK